MTANPQGGGQPGTWQDGNAALDLLVGLALGWQYQKRHGSAPGFPAAPDMTTLDTPVLAPKPPVPPPACPPPIWTRAGSSTLTVPGNGSVVDTGLDVAPWDRVTVESSGLVTLGSGGAVGPAGAGQAVWDRAYPYWGSNALAGQLLGRLGPYGAYVPLGDMFQRVYAAPVSFPAGALYPELATKRLYLLVNVPPSSPASGTFTAVVTREAAAPPAPVVTELAPATGSALGGDRIEVYGTYLQTTRQVSFSGVPAEHFTVYDDTHLWAVPPAGSGQVDVSVTTAGGTATAGFTYLAGLPVVESVTPSSGPNTGHTPVTISGRGLDQIDTAKFGVWPEPAEPQSASSATTLSGPGAGVVHVQVSGGPSGPSQTSANDLFSYLGPVILSLDPPHGDEAGGTLVTIHGTGLSGATSVSFGSAAFGGSLATDLVCVSDTVLTVRSPSGAGRPDVFVTALGVTSLPSVLPSEDDLYFYDGPALESVSPSSGPDTGYTTVTLSGTMLNHVETVFFNEVAVPFALVSPTSITAVVPPGTGGVTIYARSRYGSTTNMLNYAYQLTPAITDISPVSGPQDGQTTVSITGHDLMAGIFRLYTNIWFGDLIGFISSYTDTQITVETPSGKGQVPITVDDGFNKTVVGQYTYLSPNPLAVTALSPATGPASGGTPVVITGTGLTDVMTLSFGTNFVIFTVVSDTEIQAVAPPGTGTVYVQATTWSLTSNDPGPANQFTYV